MKDMPHNTTQAMNQTILITGLFTVLSIMASTLIIITDEKTKE